MATTESGEGEAAKADMIGLKGDRLCDSGSDSAAAKLTLGVLPSAGGGTPLLQAAKAPVRICRDTDTSAQYKV